MYNMGHRMEIYCEPDAANAIVAISEAQGVAAQIVGRTEASKNTDQTNHLSIQYKGAWLRYAL